jgi:hypothetical protein
MYVKKYDCIYYDNTIDSLSRRRRLIRVMNPLIREARRFLAVALVASVFVNIPLSMGFAATFPDDQVNYSPVNGISWYEDGLGDVDQDAIPNFHDPAPWDNSNYSPINGTYWNSSALEDADADGTPNFDDQWPDDPYNGIGSPGGPPDGPPDPGPDWDADGYPDDIDPAPQDPNNHSEVNGTDWYGNALGDDDNDTIINFSDEWPNDPNNGSGPPDGPEEPDPNNGGGPPDGPREPDPNDPDGDHFTDDDPAPQDFSNYSSYNAVSWYERIFGDDDNDTILNFFDVRPDTYDMPGSPDPTEDGDAEPASIPPC